MQKSIIEQLKIITPEEQSVLDGKSLDKSIYQNNSNDSAMYEIDAGMLMEQGRLLTVRKHTRFLHFPAHKHNYVEIVYMCSGRTVHVVNGTEIELKEGELLFLNQNSVQEIYPAGENDIAVNFIVLPEFFDHALSYMDNEENLLRSFLMECVTGTNSRTGYLHFRISDVLPVQNLIENLIWNVTNRVSNRRSINQMTMGLILLQLSNHIDRLETDAESEGEKLMLTVLSYVEENYRCCELKELADILHYDLYFLSREIKKRTGQTFTEIVQTKRLNRAAYLLRSTKRTVDDISISVGYENISYFHRIFRAKYGISPKHYRDNCK